MNCCAVFAQKLPERKACPAYIIFSDKTLVDMCVKAPLDKMEMLKVSGGGENKYMRYGERFLKTIYDYTGGVREKFYFGESSELSAAAAPEARVREVFTKKLIFI